MSAGPNTERIRILMEVSRERDRQDGKWGPQRHGPARWLAILAEEFGEAAKEAVDLEFDGTPDMPADIEGRLVTELVQVAAVAVAWLEDIYTRVPPVTDGRAGTKHVIGSCGPDCGC